MAVRYAAGFFIYRVDLQGNVQVFSELRGQQVSHTGTYGTPGGFREGNETPLQTAQREILEELGIYPNELLVRYMHTATSVGTDSIPTVYTTFLAEPNSQRDFNRNTVQWDQNEVADVDWFWLEQPPSQLVPGFANALPALRDLVREITLTKINSTMLQRYALDNSFMSFFEQYHIRDPTPESTVAGYQAMLNDFWIHITGNPYQNNNNSNSNINNNNTNNNQGPSTPPPKPPKIVVTPPNQQQQNQPSQVQSAATSPIIVTNVPVSSSVMQPQIGEHQVSQLTQIFQGLAPGGPPAQPQPSATTSRDQVDRLGRRLKRLSPRLQSPPWPNQLMDVYVLGGDVTKTRGSSDEIDWDVEMGGM
ncbi:NUDIX hydrolase domain-like protein [Biscogniauxia sp. FL1348]|nr:NUDIX hydrolase domain-like protein [Biscogniauxia sp. FL1348]